MTPLLLLHPLGADGGFWSACDNLLGRPVLAPDLPGHGAAPLPDAGAGVAGLTDAVVAGLDAADVEAVIPVGISLGGLVAQDLAARHPGRVRGLVLVDTVAVYPEPLRSTWPQRAATARAGGLEDLADAMESMWFGLGFRERHPAVVAQARHRFVTTDPEGYARTCEVLHGADTSGYLTTIGVPTLVVCGDADAPAFIAAAPALTAAVPDAQLHWLRGAQHASVVEQPQAFAALVRDFLARSGT